MKQEPEPDFLVLGYWFQEDVERHIDKSHEHAEREYEVHPTRSFMPFRGKLDCCHGLILSLNGSGICYACGRFVPAVGRII